LALFPAPSGVCRSTSEIFMKKAVPAALGAFVLLLVTACGGDDAADKLTATITSNVAEAISTPDGILDSDAADCVAEKFVGELGTEKLQDAKVVTEDGSYNENGANVDASTSAAYADALLACVDEDEATEKIEAALIAGTANTSLPTKDAKCYVTKLVRSVDLEHLLSSRIVTDAGEFNQNAADPDQDTAAKSTAALLDCIDYYALYTESRAAQVKGLDTAAFSKCLRKNLSKALLAKFLTAVQAQSAEQQTTTAQVNQKTEACEKSATEK
jgi:hypothetical protein